MLSSSIENGRDRQVLKYIFYLIWKSGAHSSVDNLPIVSGPERILWQHGIHISTFLLTWHMFYSFRYIGRYS